MTADGARPPEYRAWCSMMSRCNSETHDAYDRYGGRGIRICPEWQGANGFTRFLADMGPRPSSDHSLERIDNAGNYEPGNCRWATKQEQARNRRSNRLLTLNGVTKTAVEWATDVGLPYRIVKDRLRHGWTPARALTTPTAAQAHISVTPKPL